MAGKLIFKLKNSENFPYSPMTQLELKQTPHHLLSGPQAESYMSRKGQVRGSLESPIIEY